jgi:hypothetical protein
MASPWSKSAGRRPARLLLGSSAYLAPGFGVLLAAAALGSTAAPGRRAGRPGDPVIR